MGKELLTQYVTPQNVITVYKNSASDGRTSNSLENMGRDPAFCEWAHLSSAMQKGPLMGYVNYIPMWREYYDLVEDPAIKKAVELWTEDGLRAEEDWVY
jgi:hypothetical protein